MLKYYILNNQTCFMKIQKHNNIMNDSLPPLYITSLNLFSPFLYKYLWYFNITIVFFRYFLVNTHQCCFWLIISGFLIDESLVNFNLWLQYYILSKLLDIKYLVCYFWNTTIYFLSSLNIIYWVKSVIINIQSFMRYKMCFN